jgi:peptidoglycan/LPS O-acetylase OafA/YrhL
MVRSHGNMAWTRGNFLRYAAGRIARIYPVYILSLALVAPFILADRTPGKGSYFTAYALLIQGWLGTIPVNWNTPAWTLSCEMFFYLAFPLTAMLIRRPTWPKTLGMAAVACCLTRALWGAGVPDGVKPVVHLADFLMGMAAACAYDLAGRTRRKPCGAWLYLPASLLFVTLIGWPALLPGGIDLNTAVRPLNALMLVGFALGGGVFARALSSKFAVYLGKSSYAMYLLHVPILWWYHRWSPAYSPVLYIAAVIGISALVYALF